MLAVDRGTMNIREHHDAFMRVFNNCKDKGHDTLIMTQGGQLPYIFRGNGEPEPAEYLGVPSYDAMFYVSKSGQVAMTGSGALVLAEKFGVATLTQPNPNDPALR